MPIIVACPSCGGQLRVADELLGQRVRCPACKDTFDAARPAPAAPPPLNLSVDDEPAPPAPRPAGSPGLVGAVELRSPSDAGAAAPPAPPERGPPRPADGR